MVSKGTLPVRKQVHLPAMLALPWATVVRKAPVVSDVANSLRPSGLSSLPARTSTTTASAATSRKPRNRLTDVMHNARINTEACYQLKISMFHHACFFLSCQLSYLDSLYFWL